MIYAWHHAVALAGSLLIAALVHRSAWTRTRPRVGVALWLLLLFTATASLLGLLFSIGLRALELGVAPALAAIAGDRSTLGRLDAVAGLALTAAVAVTAGIAVVHLRSTRRRAHAQSRHRALLGVVADRRADGLTVVDHTAMVVYALPGRPAQVVATTAALARLTDDELCAAVAHEHGHLTQRHHLVTLPFTALRRALSRNRALAAVEVELDLLLELCADDHAVRLGHRDPLVRALDAVAGPGTAADAAVEIRRGRLASRPRRTGLLAATVVYGTALTLTATTLSLYALPH